MLRATFHCPPFCFFPDRRELAVNGFVAMRPENQNFRIAGYGVRGRASRQGNLRVAVHEVLVERRHVGIRSFVVLCPQRHSRNENQGRKSKKQLQ
jgi:hypothetical protein